VRRLLATLGAALALGEVGGADEAVETKDDGMITPWCREEVAWGRWVVCGKRGEIGGGVGGVVSHGMRRAGDGDKDVAGDVTRGRSVAGRVDGRGLLEPDASTEGGLKASKSASKSVRSESYRSTSAIGRDKKSEISQ
jgi:hypothetical protein